MASLDDQRGRKPVKPAATDSRMRSAPACVPWAKSSGADTLLLLHVRPGARSSALVGVHGTRLKIAVKAPPVEGQANEAVVDFLANALQLPRRRFRIDAGAASRDKIVRIESAGSHVVVPGIEALLRRAAGD